MMNFSWLPPIVAQASERLVGNLSEFAGGATVLLAVTGLSRSGKTVFITSLIHNLLSSVHNPNRMPLLNVVGERRLLAAHLEGPRATGCRSFPTSAISRRWPSRTGRSAPPISARSGSKCASRPPARRAAAERDHRKPRQPDDPDRRLSGRMAARSAAAGAELRRVVARDAAAVPQRRPRRNQRRVSAFVEQHRADEVASEQMAKQAHDLYRAYLVTARDRYGLSFLQPGRFLCRGSSAMCPISGSRRSIWEGTACSRRTRSAR